MANYVYVMGKNDAFLLSSPSLAVAGKHGKCHAMRAHKHKPQAVSDWLNPKYLGTMSGFGLH